jgi:hypothetical protein
MATVKGNLNFFVINYDTRIFDTIFVILRISVKEIPWHGRMKRGGHGLPIVSPGLAKPYPSKPCEQAIHEAAFQPFQGWPTNRAVSLRPSSTPLDTPRLTPMFPGECCIRLPMVFWGDGVIDVLVVIQLSWLSTL